jgi:hypothetical protein
MVYFILIRGQNRTYWLPGNRVKDRIMNSELLYSPHAKCVMACRKITAEDVISILKNGDVNFEESNTRNTACPSYAIEGDLAGAKKFRIIVTTVDSVAEVETAIDLNLTKDTCLCGPASGSHK